METEKIRNLSDVELTEQERQAAEQLFRLRFQMKLGQNEGVKKVRELRKDVARIKTDRPRASAGTARRRARRVSQCAAVPRPRARRSKKEAR